MNEYLFIGIGATAAYFTLREAYPHGDSIRSFHHCNLSQDFAEAKEKAKAYAEQIGLPLKVDRDMEQEMRIIQRESAEKIAARRAAIELREAEWAKEREAIHQNRLSLIASGVIPTGRYSGLPFAEVPRGYLNWVMDMAENFEEGSILRALADELIKNHSHLALPKPDPVATIGKEKQRLQLEVTVSKVRWFDRDGYTGRPERVYITTMIEKETKACLVAKTTSWRGKEGEELSIKATVKGFGEYKGQVQTIVQRVAVV